VPKLDRRPCNNCEAPWPRYHVPQKPYPTQHLVDETAGDFGGDCVESGSQPGLVQPETVGDFAPEFGAYDATDGSVISDQP